MDSILDEWMNGAKEEGDDKWMKNM
jgi:hypothetical protein